MTARISAADWRAEGEESDDVELISRAVAGDRASFQVLYRRHLDGVYARLTRMLGPVPERDDLVQQIFLDVYRALPSFRGEARFSTFLHRIVVNLVCEQLERRRRHDRRMFSISDEQLDDLVAPAASAEARAGQREELRWVLNALSAIKPKKRVAFLLVAVEGASLEEASLLLGASADTIKQRVLAARRELTARLARDQKRGEVR